MGAALGGEERIPEKSPANRATAMLGGRERRVFAAGHTIMEATPDYANSGSDGGDQVFYPNPSPLPLTWYSLQSKVKAAAKARAEEEVTGVSACWGQGCFVGGGRGGVGTAGGPSVLPTQEQG